LSLGVSVEKSKMSFGVSNRQIEYSSVSPLSNLNFLNKSYLKMLFEVIKFNRIARKQIIDQGITLDSYLDKNNFSDYFRKNYIYAMAGSIWSCSIEKAKLYPAKSFIDFFKSHGLLQVTNHPQWYFVKNGSKEYVAKIVSSIKTNNNEVYKVIKDGSGVKVIHQNGEDIFDKVIIATHADEASSITQNQSLSRFKYSKNVAVLHKDSSFMPKNPKTWASWNYVSDAANNLSLTYWMNNLQNIDNSLPLFVTLNPTRQISQSDTFYETTYHHPIFDHNFESIISELNAVQGMDGIYYVGSYFGYGFHEDGIASAYKVCKNLVNKMPW
jgi:predicted NAD/FAD-binding protein